MSDHERHLQEQQMEERRHVARENVERFVDFMIQADIGKTALYLEEHTDIHPGNGSRQWSSPAQIFYDYDHIGAGWVVSNTHNDYTSHKIILDTAETYDCGSPNRSQQMNNSSLRKPYVVTNRHRPSGDEMYWYFNAHNLIATMEATQRERA